jgi:hypothetical protein
LSQSSHYIKDKIEEMELKVQSAKNRMILDESIFNRNKKIRALEGILKLTLRDRISLSSKLIMKLPRSNWHSSRHN